MTKEEKLEKIENMERELKALKDDLENGLELPVELRSYEDWLKSCETMHYAPILGVQARNLNPYFKQKKLYAQLKLQYIADKLNDGWEPDWDSEVEVKHYLIWKEIEWGAEYNMTYDNLSIYFKWQDLALKALDIMGDDMDLLRS